MRTCSYLSTRNVFVLTAIERGFSKSVYARTCKHNCVAWLYTHYLVLTQFLLLIWGLEVYLYLTNANANFEMINTKFATCVYLWVCICVLSAVWSNHILLPVKWIPFDLWQLVVPGIVLNVLLTLPCSSFSPRATW